MLLTERSQSKKKKKKQRLYDFNYGILEKVKKNEENKKISTF